MTLDYTLIEVMKGDMKGTWLLHNVDLTTVAWLPFHTNDNYLLLTEEDSNYIPRVKHAVSIVEFVKDHNTYNYTLKVRHTLDSNHYQQTNHYLVIDHMSTVELWLSIANVVVNELRNLNRLRLKVTN